MEHPQESQVLIIADDSVNSSLDYIIPNKRLFSFDTGSDNTSLVSELSDEVQKSELLVIDNQCASHLKGYRSLFQGMTIAQLNLEYIWGVENYSHERVLTKELLVGTKLITDKRANHIHWGVQKGIAPEAIGILPGLTAQCCTTIPTFDSTRSGVLFFGTTTPKTHPYRYSILTRLMRENLQLTVKSGDASEGSLLYQSHVINLNISRNGDLNSRVFEILSAGGFLLTDELSTQSGLYTCFEKGKEFDTFGSYEELVDKITFYLNNPRDALKIAEAGYQKYLQLFTPDKQKERFWRFINGDPDELILRLKEDPRISREVEDRDGTLCSLYEWLLEQHRIKNVVVVYIEPDVESHIVDLYTDLPRLNVLRSIEELTYVDLVITTPTASIPDLLLFENMAIPGANLESSGGVFRKSESCSILFHRNGGVCTIGEQFFDEGNLQQALNIFKVLLQSGVESASLLWNYSRIAQVTGNTTEEEQMLNEAFRLDPNDRRVLISFIDFYLNMNRKDLAIGMVRHLIAIEPENGAAVKLLVSLNVDLQRFDEAFDAYKILETFGDETLLDEVQWQLIQRMSGRGQRLPKIQTKKILVITNIFPPQELGGYGRTMLDFSTILRERGHDVHVLTSDTSYLGDVPEDEPFVTRTLELFGRWVDGKAETFDYHDALPLSRKCGAIAGKYMDDFRPDAILLGNLDFVGIHVIQEATARRIPMIHRLGNRLPGYEPDFIVNNDLYRLATCSGWLRDQIWSDGYRLKQINVVYPAGKVHFYHREELPDVKRDVLNIAFAGIVQPYKGPHVLLKALFYLRHWNIPFTCDFAGTTTDEKFYDSLVDLVEREGLSEQIRFVGFLNRDELKDLFYRSSVYVQPSVFEEPFGISHVEAMASGITVVTSGTGGSKEIIHDGVNGLHFKTENPEDLALKLKYLYEHPSEQDRMRRAGQIRALEKFDNQSSVDRLEEIFEELLRAQA